MLIGYARVSKQDESQVLDLQIDALKEYGVKSKNIYSDKTSGIKDVRPGLSVCLKALREGDKLVIYKLDRLGRSTLHLVQLADELNSQGVGLVILADSVLGQVDTKTASGKLLYSLMSSLAEFERTLISERTLAGLKAARARGRFGGRPRKMTPSKIKMAARSMKDRTTKPTQLARELSISTSTLYNYVTSLGSVTELGQKIIDDERYKNA